MGLVRYSSSIPTPTTMYVMASTYSVTGVCRLPVLDCERPSILTNKHCSGRDWLSTPSDKLWNLIYLAIKALNSHSEFIGAIQINLPIYLSKSPHPKTVWRVDWWDPELHGVARFLLSTYGNSRPILLSCCVCLERVCNGGEMSGVWGKDWSW